MLLINKTKLIQLMILSPGRQKFVRVRDGERRSVHHAHRRPCGDRLSRGAEQAGGTVRRPESPGSSHGSPVVWCPARGREEA